MAMPGENSFKYTESGLMLKGSFPLVPGGYAELSINRDTLQFEYFTTGPLATQNAMYNGQCQKTEARL